LDTVELVVNSVLHVHPKEINRTDSWVLNGAELWLYAPDIGIGNRVTVELGAVFHAGFVP
jgi:hypothetical protein